MSTPAPVSPPQDSPASSLTGPPGPTGPQGGGSLREITHIPSLRCFWISQCGSYLAYNMLAVVIGWQIYAMTGSALHLGLVGLAQFTPQLLLTLVVGGVADRFDRRRIAFFCQLAEGLMAVALAVGSATGTLTPAGVFAGAFLTGAARAFEQPAMNALLPGLVPVVALPRVLAFGAGLRQASIIAGPALGGFLCAAGAQVGYGVCGAAFLTACAAILLVRRPDTAASREPMTLRSLFGGIDYVRRNPVILGAISLDLFSVLLGGATALLPIYASDILHTGPWGLGLLRAAPAVGALCMSVYLARVPMRRRVGRRLFAGVVGFGVATITFGLSRSFPLSMAALAALGACDMISVVVRQTLVQLETPDAMRGRVGAVNSVFIGTSNQLGEFESGVTAAWFGATASVALGGVGTIVVALLWMRLFPALLRRDELVSTSAESPYQASSEVTAAPSAPDAPDAPDVDDTPDAETRPETARASG
ncbi:MFS transporter [Nitratidesulfovibrio sp. HK-II]|uniref:MFS transporter n=1 Tax=Nitratidesulfovibrio sp. HK-II TaxID=2009266 RepID=UPI001E44FA6D|nr:MFS transporter [Nitratidesulfovibrio sp. HK-II]